MIKFGFWRNVRTAGDRIRTDDVQLGKPRPRIINNDNSKSYKISNADVSASDSSNLQFASFDDDLQTVIYAWTELPEAAKKYILAIIREADGHSEE